MEAEKILKMFLLRVSVFCRTSGFGSCSETVKHEDAVLSLAFNDIDVGLRARGGKALPNPVSPEGLQIPQNCLLTG